MSEQEKLKEAIKKVKKQSRILDSEFYLLKRKCEKLGHEIVKCEITENHESAVCSICDTILGRWCENAPTNVCEFDENTGYGECCIYCGRPKESS